MWAAVVAPGMLLATRRYATVPEPSSTTRKVATPRDALVAAAHRGTSCSALRTTVNVLRGGAAETVIAITANARAVVTKASDSLRMNILPRKSGYKEYETARAPDQLSPRR